MSTTSAVSVMHPTYRIDQRAEMWEQLFIFGWCAEFFLDHSAGLRGRFSVDREDDVNFSPGFIERSAFSIKNGSGRFFILDMYLLISHRTFTHPAGDGRTMCAFYACKWPRNLDASRDSSGLRHVRPGIQGAIRCMSTGHIRQYGTKSYVVFPPVGFQRPSRTEIGDLKWFDRVRALRPIIHLARKLKLKLRL